MKTRAEGLLLLGLEKINGSLQSGVKQPLGFKWVTGVL